MIKISFEQDKISFILQDKLLIIFKVSNHLNISSTLLLCLGRLVGFTLKKHSTYILLGTCDKFPKGLFRWTIGNY